MTCLQLRYCTHPSDEQLQHRYIFSNYYNLQSVHFEINHSCEHSDQELVEVGMRVSLGDCD